MSKKGFPHARSRGHLIIKTAKQGKKQFLAKTVFNLFNILKTTREQKLRQTNPFVVEFTSASDEEKYCCLEHKFKYLVIHQVKVKNHQTKGMAD